MEALEACPLPEDPTLAAMASALNDAGQWAEILDQGWCGLFLTDRPGACMAGEQGLRHIRSGRIPTVPKL